MNEEQTLPQQDTNNEPLNNMEVELSALKDQLLRALAENDNLRKRFLKEKEDLLKYGVTNLAKDFISVADNLRRAFKVANDDGANTDKIKGLVEGVELIIKDLENIFKKYNIVRHHPKGEKFDANLHQAMFEVEHEEHEPGTIVEVLQDGYLIHDRLLRPAMVGVSKKPS